VHDPSTTETPATAPPTGSPPTGRPTRVMVVDDHAAFRLAARSLVARTPNFELVAEAESGEEAVELTVPHRPDLVLMDVNLGGMTGPEATRHIVDAFPRTVVVLVSTYAADDLAIDVGASGALAYVRKDDLAPGVLTALWHDHRPP
jgi:two-component system invasion response regulator UvrY